MSGKRVLVVDDEASIRLTLGKDLESSGYDVTIVENGEMAVMKLKELHYDLVITDLLMEGLDGIQVLKSAKKN